MKSEQDQAQIANVKKKLKSIAEFKIMAKEFMVYQEPEYASRKTDRIVTQQDLSYELSTPASSSLSTFSSNPPPTLQWEKWYEHFSQIFYFSPKFGIFSQRNLYLKSADLK